MKWPLLLGPAATTTNPKAVYVVTEQAYVNSVMIGAVSLVLAGLLAYFVRLNGRLQENAVEIATLKTQISPLWAQVQAKIAADLHHPHERYFEMDALLEKLEALTISSPERARLKHLLSQRAEDTHPDITQDQRSKAALMIQVMDLVLVEAQVKDDGLTQQANLQSLANQTLRNIDKAKVAATIVSEQVEQQSENAKSVSQKAGEHFEKLLKDKDDAKNKS